MNPLFLRILIICLDVSGIFASDLSATLYIVYYVKIRMSINQHVFLRSNLYGTGAHIIKEILAPFLSKKCNKIENVEKIKILGTLKNQHLQGLLNVGAPDRSRTCDRLIRSESLYPLSYWRMSRFANYTI